MAVSRVVIVSDTHLSRRAPEAIANWDAVVDYVARSRPDLVVHLGDLTLDGADDPEDLTDARRQLDRLVAPWLAVPGNHDIGDNPWPGGPDEWFITAERRQRWLDVIGPDWWSMRIDGWTLVAYNAQLAESGLAADAEQWDWLAGELTVAKEESADKRGRSIALIGHKPMAAPDAELEGAPPYRYLPPSARARLWDLVGARRVPIAVSGHVHQYRELELEPDGVTHVWAPTAWAVLPDDLQETLGTKRVGILSLQLDDRGGSEVALVEPAGIAQLTIGRDFASPYDH